MPSKRNQLLPADPKRAFTLVEIMLSLFLALILLVGMNSVFKATSDAVRTGQTLSELTRNGRTVQPVIYGDLRDCATDSPFFIITSGEVPQFRNAADAKASTAAASLPGAALPAGQTGPLPQSGCLLGDHMHRVDMLGFFARGLFRRKTADTPIDPSGTAIPTYQVSNTTSDEAFIHYGHLRMLGTDGASFIGPDDYAGPAEPYASDWVLGRNVILMLASSPTAVQTNATLSNSNTDTIAGDSEIHYTRTLAGKPPFPWSKAPNPAAVNMTPFGYDGTANGGIAVQSSRYDLAAVSIEQFRSALSTAVLVQKQNASFQNNWWSPLIYDQLFTALSNGYPQFQLQQAQLTPPYNKAPYFNPPPANLANFLYARNRFQGAKLLSTTPLTASDQANLAPIFLEHVSQFIVEYAGDYTTQDTAGNIMDTASDGQIDWLYATKGQWLATNNYQIGDWVIFNGKYYQATANSVNSAPGSGPWGASSLPNVAGVQFMPPKVIRWYGMPRDSTGSGVVHSSYYVLGGAPGNLTDSVYDNPVNPPMASYLNNVVPLTDLFRLSVNNANRPVPHEVEAGPTLIDPNKGGAPPFVNDYANASYSGSFANGMNPNARYTAVWQNDVPAMVRIIYKVDDPNNDLQDGPTYECVFKLK